MRDEPLLSPTLCDPIPYLQAALPQSPGCAIKTVSAGRDYSRVNDNLRSLYNLLAAPFNSRSALIAGYSTCITMDDTPLCSLNSLTEGTQHVSSEMNKMSAHNWTIVSNPCRLRFSSALY